MWGWTWKGKPQTQRAKKIHTFMPINDWCQICSQDSWVMSFPVDQWEETQIWVRPVEGEWLTAETAARLSTAGLYMLRPCLRLRPRSLSLSLPCHVWRKKNGPQLFRYHRELLLLKFWWHGCVEMHLHCTEWTYIIKIHIQFKSQGGQRHIYFLLLGRFESLN